MVDARQLPRSAGLRSGELAITRVVPFASSRPEPFTSAVFLVDTSASRGLGLPEQARLVKSLLSNMPPYATVTVGCFDQEVMPIYEGKASDFGDKETASILARAERSARRMSSKPSRGPASRRSAPKRNASCWWATASRPPETDANDVDFHIHDGKGGRAYYGARRLPSGGELYADVTTGYGPECFTIRGARDTRAYPYRLQAHYYSRGPMGDGMGKLEVVEHDGRGHISFEERPFVVMVDQPYVDLGSVDKP